MISLMPTRREMLARAANGFGAVALVSLLAERAAGAPVRHHAAKAKSVVSTPPKHFGKIDIVAFDPENWKNQGKR